MNRSRLIVALFSASPLLLSAFIVTGCRDILSIAFGSSLVLILLVTVAQLVLAGKSGARPLLESILISSSGVFGMALGALLDHKQRPSCCPSVFDLDALRSWSTMLMALFCIVGSRVLGARFIQVGAIRICSDWISLPFMFAGMWLSVCYLSVPMRPLFGSLLAAHWAMYIGMIAGHLVECLSGWCVARIAAPLSHRRKAH